MTQKACIPESIPWLWPKALGCSAHSLWHEELCDQECWVIQLASPDHGSSAEDQHILWLFDLLGSMKSSACLPVPVGLATEVVGKTTEGYLPAHTAQTAPQNCVYFPRHLRASPTRALWHTIWEYSRMMNTANTQGTLPTLKQIKGRGYRDDCVVKSTRCLAEDPSSVHRTRMSGDLTPSSGLDGHLHSQTHKWFKRKISLWGRWKVPGVLVRWSASASAWWKEHVWPLLFRDLTPPSTDGSYMTTPQGPVSHSEEWQPESWHHTLSTQLWAARWEAMWAGVPAQGMPLGCFIYLFTLNTGRLKCPFPTLLKKKSIKAKDNLVWFSWCSLLEITRMLEN